MRFLFYISISLLILLIAWFLPACIGTNAIASDLGEAFPLANGAVWTYDVVLDYQEGEAVVRWAGQVTERITGGERRGTVAIFHFDRSGYPLDHGVRETVGNYVIFPDRLYQLSRELDVDKLITTNGMGFEWAQILAWPLRVGQEWGEPAMLERRDGWYVWQVEDREMMQTLAGRRDCYHLIYRTLADNQRVWFCPDVGFVRWQYHHNGSPYDEVWSLIGRSMSP